MLTVYFLRQGLVTYQEHRQLDIIPEVSQQFKAVHAQPVRFVNDEQIRALLDAFFGLVVQVKGAHPVAPVGRPLFAWSKPQILQNLILRGDALTPQNAVIEGKVLFGIVYGCTLPNAGSSRKGDNPAL
jgi:hypothetical protein